VNVPAVFAMLGFFAGVACTFVGIFYAFIKSDKDGES